MPAATVSLGDDGVLSKYFWFAIKRQPKQSNQVDNLLARHTVQTQHTRRCIVVHRENILKQVRMKRFQKHATITHTARKRRGRNKGKVYIVQPNSHYAKTLYSALHLYRMRLHPSATGPGARVDEDVRDVVGLYHTEQEALVQEGERAQIARHLQGQRPVGRVPQRAVPKRGVRCSYPGRGLRGGCAWRRGQVRGAVHLHQNREVAWETHTKHDEDCGYDTAYGRC